MRATFFTCGLVALFAVAQADVTGGESSSPPTTRDAVGVDHAVKIITSRRIWLTHMGRDLRAAKLGECSSDSNIRSSDRHSSSLYGLHLPVRE